MQATSPTHYTSGELGDVLGIQAWRISRLFELGIVNEPPRVGGRRLIPRTMVPDIILALRGKNWLPTSEEAVS
jgi:hypothetical protein